MSETVVDHLVESFKESMSRVSSSVAVVTTTADRPHGTTVSAFMSLSVSPPMVVVSLDRTSELLALIRTTGRLGINVLSHDQIEIARNFARKGTDKFEAVPWMLDHGMPRLERIASWLRCSAAQLVDGGDHVLVFAAVEAAEVDDLRPLTYHARSFGTHAPFVPSHATGGAR